jgi:hypothetical protein
MGDLQDLIVCAQVLSSKEAGRWHSKGHKIWSYSNPQVGVENPEVYRRNYGLLLWKDKYDGACDYAYQWSAGNIWNDFDSPGGWRGHNFTYPTVDGVIGTIAWEGYREGVNDVRYVTTLERLIREADISKNVRQKEIARSAKQYLETVQPLTDDLDVVRTKLADYILKLTRK